MIKFNEFYSFENFLNNFNINKKRLLKINNKKEITLSEKEDLYNHKEFFFMAIIKFLQTNLKEKLLKIDNIEKHTFVYNKILDKILSLEEHSYSQKEINYLGYLFKGKLFLELSNPDISDNEIYENYLKFCDYISKGTFFPTDLDFDSQDCQNCSKYLSLKFINWQPILKANDKSTDLKCIKKEITKKEFTINSNELLIADWFRIDEFTSQVKYNEDRLSPSINTYNGRVLSTLHSIANGFISIHVDNTCPSIFTKNNNIYGVEFCDIEEDEEIIKESDFKYQGYVCTDLWNVTMIEKSVLIDIIKRKNPNAEKIVEDYISENFDDIVKLEVIPGKYEIEFHGDHDKFHKEKNINLEFEGNMIFSLNKINN